MSIRFAGKFLPDVQSCHYGHARLNFRGPERDLRQDFVAVLGGSEAYGPQVALPFPALMEPCLGMGVANLAQAQASADFYLTEPAVLEVAAKARAVAVVVMGAANQSNSFYRVHPRRNDRFIQASPQLRALYPEVDFTEFHFTQHLLRHLHAVSAKRFDVVVQELREVWIERMRELLGRIPVPLVLTWIARIGPPAAGGAVDLGQKPVLVDADMLAQLLDLVSDYTEMTLAADLNEEMWGHHHISNLLGPRMMGQL